MIAVVYSSIRAILSSATLHIYVYGAAIQGTSKVNLQSPSSSVSIRCPVADKPATFHDQKRPSSYTVIINGSQTPAAVLILPSVPCLMKRLLLCTAFTEGPHCGHMVVSVSRFHIWLQGLLNDRLTSGAKKDMATPSIVPL